MTSRVSVAGRAARTYVPLALALAIMTPGHSATASTPGASPPSVPAPAATPPPAAASVGVVPTPVALLGMAVPGLVSPVGVPGAFHETRKLTHEEPVPDRGRFRLCINLHLGSVTLRSWTKDSVRIEATLRGDGQTMLDARRSLAGMDLAFDRRGRTLSLFSQFFGLAGFDTAWRYIRRGERPGAVDLIVMAPPRVHTLVYIALGAIAIDGFAGSVSARTIDGPIFARGAHGRLILESLAGRIGLDHVDAKVLARSATGGIEALAMTGAMDARTASGPVHLDLAAPGLADQWVWTRSGHVEIDLPPDQPIRVEDHGPLQQSTFLPRMLDHQLGRGFRRAQVARPLAFVDVYDREGDVLVRDR